MQLKIGYLFQCPPFIYEAFAPTGRFALFYRLDSLAAFFQNPS